MVLHTGRDIRDRRNTLLGDSDVLSLHIHLTPETDRLIGADALARMKSNAILLNTSRGRIVDEAALLGALETGKIAGAGDRGALKVRIGGKTNHKMQAQDNDRDNPSQHMV